MNASIVGSMAVVSARLSSNASTVSGNPAASVSSPMVICGSRAAALEHPDSRKPSPTSVSKCKVDMSSVASDAGPYLTCAAHAAVEPAPEPLIGTGGQVTFDGGVGRRVDTSASTRRLSCLLVGSTIHANANCHLITGGLIEPEQVVGRTQPVPQMPHL